MRVTAVERRPKSLCAVFADGEPLGLIDAETWALSRVRPGDALTEEDWAVLQEESDYSRAKSRALFLLNRRDYSRRQLEEKLARDFSGQAVERVAGRMEELGLLDDDRYARRAAEAMIAQKGLSGRAVVMELMRKGIARDLAQEVALELSPAAEERIAALLQNQYARALCDEKGRKRTVAALMRKGYRWEQIRTPLREALERLQEEEDWLGEP